MKEKRSFFRKIAGAIAPERDSYEEDESSSLPVPEKKHWIDPEDDEGQLTVDVYETPHAIIIKTIVAGVKKEDLEIALSRDMVTIRGHRQVEEHIEENDYFHKELYWGVFSRTILLPHEVDIDEAEATENQGLLTLKLPKIDKERKAKIKVKSL